jgi:ABC-type dipeptide/oligopeptide/nickel transport system permease subunit
LSRLLYGIRTSFYVSAAVTVVSLLIGMAIGLIAGFYRGWLDRFLSALMDIAWGFPIVLVAIVVVAIVGPGVRAILIGICVVNWAGFARIIRAETLAIREREFVEAARTVGAGVPRLLLRHVLPNTLPLTFVMASFYMGIVITAEAGLSFIGLGAQPPLPSLGQMVSEGKSYLFKDLWLITIPGTVLALTVLAFNQLGDSLRDAIDPRLQV